MPEAKRKCLNGLSAETPVKTPADSEFFKGRLLESPQLLEILQGIIAEPTRKLKELTHAEIRFRVLWRKTATSYRGVKQLTAIKRAGPELTYFTDTDFVIYVAADLAREFGLNHWQLEAALYRRLLEVRVDVDQDGALDVSMRPPDVTAFASEIEHYGLWSAELASAREAFKQAPLFGDSVATFDRQTAALSRERKPKEKTAESA